MAYLHPSRLRWVETLQTDSPSPSSQGAAATPATSSGGPRPPRFLRALGAYNYRLWFGGQGLSLIGTWMQRVTVSWVVWTMTHSALLLGLVGFAGQIFTFALSPVAGVLSDRWNRYRIMLVTQTLSLVQAALMAALALAHMLTVWEIFVLSAVLGAINAFDVPARQAFTVEMVERAEDLPNAIALNSTLVNGARMVGPATAGILLKAVGAGVSFLLNAVSFVFVIGALLLMHVTFRPRQRGKQRMGREMAEGLSYVRQNRPIRTVLIILALVSLFAMPYQQLMPIFAAQILRGGPQTLGFLMAAAGVGAIAGSIFLASREDPRHLPLALLVGLFLFGGALVGFALSHTLWLSLAILVLVGFGMMVLITAGNTLLQTVVDDEMRGRVMSLYTMAFFGMGPWGNLLAGALASAVGAPFTIAVAGTLCLASGVAFARPLLELARAPRDSSATRQRGPA